MPNSMAQSSNNSPVNNQRNGQSKLNGKIQPQATTINQQKQANFVGNVPSMGNSRTMANSMNVSPVKQKSNVINMGNSFKSNQSKHPILANKQQKMQQQMQFKQTLVNQQQIYGQPNQSNGFRNNIHFAKSECPSPN